MKPRLHKAALPFGQDLSAPDRRGPAALAWGALAATAAGAGVSAYGAYQTGQAQSQAAQYQAGVARNNQVVADYNAKLALASGQNMEAAKREQTQQVIAQQRAVVGGSGLDPNSGSSLRLQTDVAQLGELDAATIRSNAVQAAYGYKTQGMSFGAQAALESSQAGYATRGGQLGAFTSLVGGASGVSSKWLSFQQVGVRGFGGGAQPEV